MSPGGSYYQIRVAENLDQHWQSWFEELTLAPAPDSAQAGTCLQGYLPDQAALFGLLARLRNLNLTLLEVRWIEHP